MRYIDGNWSDILARTGPEASFWAANPLVVSPKQRRFAAYRIVMSTILAICLTFNPSHAAPACKDCLQAAASRAPAYVPRDTHGRIQRSPVAKNAFKRAYPCPSTGRATGACPGYVVDHVIALCVGGVDAPSNLQWQNVADAKAKDRVECRR